MDFFGRVTELEKLDSEYRRDSASFVLLHGCPRVGKTSLIRKFVEHKKYFYFLASEESEAMNRDAFKRLVANYLNDDLLRESVVESWEVIFKELLSKIEAQRLVIVFDEFQNLSHNNESFISVFQSIWDNFLSKANVMVILSCSLVSSFSSQLLSFSSPLYGRFTSQIRLLPLSFSQYHEYMKKDISEVELVKRYSVTGGFPKYIEALNNTDSLKKAIQLNLLNPSCPIYEEPLNLIQKELREPGVYLSLLRAIATGNHNLTNISSQTQQKMTNLPRYLKVLMDLDIIERDVPVTEKNPEKSKRGRYKIKDNFLSFWFKYIYPNRSYIEIGKGDTVIESLSKSFVESHVSEVYKQICLEKLWTLSTKGLFPDILERVGRWWDNSHEIDVVGLSENDDLLVVGECKFWKGPVGANILYQLEQKTAFIDWHKASRKTIYVIFSINGFTDDIKSLAQGRDDVFLI